MTPREQATHQAHPRNATAFRSQVVRGPDGLDAYVDAIDALAGTALEANPFYEPWLLFPALKTLADAQVRVVLVWQGDRLSGLFPLHLQPAGWRSGPARLRLWQHRYCFLCTPLVDAEAAPGTWATLLDWVQHHAHPATLLELQKVGATGAFEQSLQAALQASTRWSHRLRRYERALLQVGDGQAMPGLTGKRLKEFRRIERRLADRGRVEFRVLALQEDPTAWIDRFLALEASGWKGEQGTALSTDPQGRQFFIEATQQAHRQGKLHMLALELDGDAIAMQCNFLCNGGGYAFKVAFDERHAAFAPGVQLELFAMRQFASLDPPVAWVDSCAHADHALMNRLWTDRRPLADWELAAPTLSGRLWLARRRLQAWLRARVPR